MTAQEQVIAIYERGCYIESEVFFTWGKTAVLVEHNGRKWFVQYEKNEYGVFTPVAVMEGIK